jgi:hypothetical protein
MHFVLKDLKKLLKDNQEKEKEERLRKRLFF